MSRTLAIAIVIAATAAAQADTGGSVGGGNWSHSKATYTPTHTPTRASDDELFGTTDHTPDLPVYTPPPMPSFDDTTRGSDGLTRGYVPMPERPPEDHDFIFDHFDLLFIAVALFIVGTGIKVVVFGDGPVRPDKLDRALAHAGDTDVTVLRVALDGRARKFVQTQMATITAGADTRTDDGRVKLLREVTLLVRRLRDAWVYGGADNEPIRDMEHSKSAFDRHVDDARSRFREETVRNEQGATTTARPSAYTPRADEGEGLILVSFIIAARQELFTVKTIASGDDLRRALEAAGSLESWTLVAVEIVWQPSVDTDRLSSMELVAKYPPPELVAIQGALVGKTFCSYCGGPYPAELVSCPHCGAPAKHAA